MIIKNPITLWLFFTAFMVWAMMIIGAITRLTESGLSITTWDPIMGALPPLNEQDWLNSFNLYKESPEFIQKNSWMGLEDYKTIYFWEWFHRLWGRLIGLCYALPLFYFLITKKIEKSLIAPLCGLLLLGGLQGFMGWFMVQSGLVDEPAVSHYRLAAHLSLAFVLFSLLIWFGLKTAGVARKYMPAIQKSAFPSLGLLVITILWGAFVAGKDAGQIYNEWPLMGGAFMPPEMWFLRPAWLNIFENEAAIQFTHRWLAIIALASLLHTCFAGVQKGGNTILHYGLGLCAFTQVLLGIATVLSQVNIALAAAHQANAAILVGFLVIIIYTSKNPKKQSPL